MGGPPDFILQNHTNYLLRIGQNQTESKETNSQPAFGFTLSPHSQLHWAYSEPFAKRSISVSVSTNNNSFVSSVVELDSLLKSKSSNHTITLDEKSISVLSHAEGPTRIVCFQESNDSPSTGSDAGSIALLVRNAMAIVLEFASIGVSIIDDFPREIVVMTLRDLLLSTAEDENSSVVEFVLGDVQIDNQLFNRSNFHLKFSSQLLFSFQALSCGSESRSRS
jgi:hypothetical protein